MKTAASMLTPAGNSDFAGALALVQEVLAFAQLHAKRQFKQYFVPIFVRIAQTSKSGRNHKEKQQLATSRWTSQAALSRIARMRDTSLSRQMFFSPDYFLHSGDLAHLTFLCGGFPKKQSLLSTDRKPGREFAPHRVATIVPSQTVLLKCLLHLSMTECTRTEYSLLRH